MISRQAEAVGFCIGLLQENLKQVDWSIAYYSDELNLKFADFKKLSDRELPKLLEKKERLTTYLESLKSL